MLVEADLVRTDTQTHTHTKKNNSLAARSSPRCLPLCGHAAGARGEGLANLALDWIFLEFHYGFPWYDRSRVAWADFVTRMAVVHVPRHKSHEYR